MLQLWKPLGRPLSYAERLTGSSCLGSRLVGLIVVESKLLIIILRLAILLLSNEGVRLSQVAIPAPDETKKQIQTILDLNIFNPLDPKFILFSYYIDQKNH